MRIMMEENHIHYDVIAKLWQVYSMLLFSSSSPRSDSLKGKERHLPKPQRRGAIIILGMLALAKRSVLTDKVDVMLKVGLGPLGKVRIQILSFSPLFIKIIGGSHIGAVYVHSLAAIKR